MKQVFLLAVDRLKTVPTIRWIDMDKGQLNNYEVRPPVAFPCALIKIDYVACENIGGGKQKCRVRVTIRLAWDYTGETDATMSEARLQSSLLYLDLVEDTYKSLQGFHQNPVIIAPFNRVSQLEENRPDGLKVVNILFETYVHSFPE